MYSNIAAAAIGYDYAVIVGHGRSGTNWLLDILDASPLTHVRNEPNEIAGAPLAALPSPWVRHASQPDLEQRWDEAAAWAARHMGNRDHHAHGPKIYHHPWATALHLPRALVRPRMRGALSRFMPALRAGEWPLPPWAGSQGRMQTAFPVLKFTQVPGWACWLLEQRPRAAILHILRHPGGFLHSWRNRYVAKHDREQVAQENRDRLAAIAAADPAWAARFGPVESMALEESELWFWRYAGETIHLSGQDRPHYLRIVYEHLAADPLVWAEKVYDFCGLPWDSAVSARIAGTTGESKTIAGAWREKLERADVVLIDRILEDSPLRAWWEEA
jgi:LPS sulfotransferase NodH